jgi:hypothetical protein
MGISVTVQSNFLTYSKHFRVSLTCTTKKCCCISNSVIVIKWAKWKCSCRSFWGNSIKDSAVNLKLRTKVEYSCVMQELRIFSHSFPWYWLLDFNFNGINPLSLELNLIWYLLALLAHHFLHVSRIRVKSLTLRVLMSYIYIYIYIYIYTTLVT